MSLIAWTCFSSSNLPVWLEAVLELERAIEVVLEGPLAAAGDDQDVGRCPALDRLLHHVLDGRLVDDGQHLLRLRLRRREEPRSQAGRGDDRLLDRHEVSFRLAEVGGRHECRSLSVGRPRSTASVGRHPSSRHVGSSDGSTSSITSGVDRSDRASSSMVAASSGPTNRSNSGTPSRFSRRILASPTSLDRRPGGAPRVGGAP